MAVTKTILANTHFETVVLLQGSGTGTIDLQTDCKLANETLQATQTVNINEIGLAGLQASLTITRNSEQIFKLWADGQFTKYDIYSNNPPLKRQNTYDIDYNMPVESTAIIKLSKVGGYDGAPGVNPDL